MSNRYHIAQSALLAWYDLNHRSLPWRVNPLDLKNGQRPNPYHVWLSEIMLQQTTVATVKSYFEKFTNIWPSVQDLAAADRDDVMAAWAGLGYYARARNLHEAAKKITQDYGGQFPKTENALLLLPGIGAYTAAAIAAIAFGRRAVVVDGNIERVTARWDAIDTPLPQAKPQMYHVMDQLTPEDRAGDFAQAMMDLGASLCTPARKSGANLTLPSCLICPLQSTCATTGEKAASLPRKMPKKKRPERHGLALIILDNAGHIAIERRPDQGLLGGLDVFPGSAWADGNAKTTQYDLDKTAPLGVFYHDAGGGERYNNSAEHIFTHFKALIDVEKLTLNRSKPDLPAGLRWVKVSDLSTLAMPTVMVKVAKIAQILNQND